MNPLKRPDGFIVTQAKLDALNTLIDGSNCRQAVERAIGHPIPRTANPDDNSPNSNALYPDLVLPASFATSFALASQTGYAIDSDHDTEIEEVHRDPIPRAIIRGPFPRVYLFVFQGSNRPEYSLSQLDDLRFRNHLPCLP